MNMFDCAIKMETEARDHYAELAAAATTPEMKNLFTLLAGAEEEHLATLVRMKESLEPDKARFDALTDAACIFRPLLDQRELMAELENDPDAYQHVVKEEKESIAFYEKLVDQATDGETRRLLNLIAEEEKRHLSIVENIYAFMEEPKSYLAWGEFSNLREY
jgi:rubrerythrin